MEVDNKSKFIDTYEVTDASAHDYQALEPLLNENEKNQELYADSAYTGVEQENTINAKGIINRVHESAYNNKPLTDEQKESNRGKSTLLTICIDTNKLSD